MKLKVGDIIRHTTSINMLREITEVRSTDYTWKYVGGNSERDYLSENSSDPYFNENWVFLEKDMKTDLEKFKEEFSFLDDSADTEDYSGLVDTLLIMYEEGWLDWIYKYTRNKNDALETIKKIVNGEYITKSETVDKIFAIVNKQFDYTI